MALSAAQITTIIETLEAQLGSAAGSEQFRDMRVTWSTTDELTAKISYWRDKLAEVDGTSTTAVTSFIRMRASGMGY